MLVGSLAEIALFFLVIGLALPFIAHHFSIFALISPIIALIPDIWRRIEWATCSSTHVSTIPSMKAL
ncbi:hypothetical protein J27TS8_30380 [Robertmurraya siralis]|uniref:Uncharacterized protein n=1 Tax=Robertmurraya siralis TaxID=77777 RepID=A0A919WJ83_9BACI|nr:hypothetical protein [Robertmurraya siralis]GIN63045.1 hypothetical protein J27TS8_30380 [Robertmurraya siralis]